MTAPADWLQANLAMLKKSADAIALLTPDGGGRVISGPSKLPKLAELLQWQPLAAGAPDDDITVLGAWDPEEPPEAVFKDGDVWRLCHSAEECAPPVHWAEWPAGPK